MNLLAHLRSLEEHLLDPVARHSAAELEYLLASDFTEFGSSGRIFTREEIISALASEPAPASLTLTHCDLLASSDDWALITYRVTRTNSEGGAESVSLRSSTWIFRQGRWQMLFHQGTPAPMPALS